MSWSNRFVNKARIRKTGQVVIDMLHNKPKKLDVKNMPTVQDDPEIASACNAIPKIPVVKHKKSLETPIVRECLGLLHKLGIFAWRENVGKFQTQSGGYMSFGIKGLADIIGLLPDGRFLAVEVKSEVGKQSEHQKLFESKIRSNNGAYFLVRSANELYIRLKENIKWQE